MDLRKAMTAFLRKLISVFLVVVMVFGGTTGCARNNSATSSVSSGKNSSSGEASDSDENPGSGEVADSGKVKDSDETSDSSNQQTNATLSEEKSSLAENMLSEENTLKNPNATKEVRILNNYIRGIYGQRILSGQQESTWMGSPDYEMDYILETTGKLPAIRGMDYINEDFDGVTQRAIEWWNQGGIVSICWHWGTPPDGVGYESSKGTADLKEMFAEGSAVNKGMLAQMDRVAEELKKLQKAGVPVLWRPFHEFDGGWFWWGRGGPEIFKKLWTLMYDRFTNHHGLNNLIWVLGYSSKVKNGWYPGDAYVDIAGADHYGEGTQIAKYKKVLKIVGTEMPVAYHENGPIPDPDAMAADGAKWAWFLTWHTTYIMEQNTPEYLKMVYNHDYVITRDELADFR
jgi:mannan endo-1,4-beta-mannosidase